jgi:hypothetical protein
MPEDIREHRRRRNLEELRSLLGGDPELRARYDAATQGRIPAPEALHMVKDTPISLRIPEAMLERADALVPLLGDDPELAMVVGGKVTRSTVLRVALLRGIKALEADFATEDDHEGAA